MILRKLTLGGTHAYPAETEIPLPQAGGIIALAGDNGSGKTTVLDAIHIALFGRVPNRVASSGNETGAIYEQFPRRGLVDLEFAMRGKEIRIRRLIDGEKRKQVPHLWIDGRPVTEGKAREFEEALAAAIGISEAFYLASVYVAQSGRGGVTSLDDRGRRGLLDEVLDLAQFDAPLEIVSEDHRQTSARIAALEPLTQSEQADLLPQLRLQLSQEKARTDDFYASVEALREAQQADGQRLADLRAGRQDVRDAEQRAALLRREIMELEAQAKERQLRIEKNERELLGRRDEILASAKQVEELTRQSAAKIQERDALGSKLESEQAEADARIKSKREELTAARALLTVTEAEERRYRDEFGRLRSDLQVVTRDLTAAHQQSGLLGDVPCADQPALHSTCKLLGSARDAAARIPDLTSSKARLVEELARLEQNPPAAADEIRGQIKALEERIESLSADPKIAHLKREIGTVERAWRELEDRINAARPIAGLQAQLEGAEERIADYQREVEGFEAQIKDRCAILTELEQRIKDAGDDSAEAELSRAIEQRRREIETREFEIRASISATASLEAQIALAESNEREIAAAKAKLSALKTRLARLALLREGLGPKGARALRIDAAGPGIAATVNALLAECYGSRFQLRIQTQRETGKGDLKEALQITVIDNDNGSETMVENKSGGEQAIIKEALSLGLALYKRQHSSADIRTLIRDETTAPLSDANGELYLRMLRKARELGGFHQVIFVSHKGALVEQADAVIEVGGGKAVLRMAA